LWSLNEDEGQDVKQGPFDKPSTSSSGVTPPPTMMFGDSEQQPMVDDDIDLTHLEMASLELLSLCNDLGAR
jgi:hypothetical protein